MFVWKGNGNPYMRKRMLQFTACLPRVLAKLFIIFLITAAACTDPISDTNSHSTNKAVNQNSKPFGIHIIDEATGRGVSLRSGSCWKDCVVRLPFQSYAAGKGLRPASITNGTRRFWSPARMV